MNSIKTNTQKCIKEDHTQKPNILKLILPKIEGLEYGILVDIELETDQIDIIDN